MAGIPACHEQPSARRGQADERNRRVESRKRVMGDPEGRAVRRGERAIVKVAETVSDATGAFAFPDDPAGPPRPHFYWVTVPVYNQITLMAILGATKPSSLN